MHVFVTGASGWIGIPTVRNLLAAGHQVSGLARSDAAAWTVEAAGAAVVHGSIDDTEVLRAAAAASDGVLHLAFRHDIAFSGDFAGAAQSDRRAVWTFGEVLAGSGRPLLIASGVLGAAGAGQVATERDGHDADAVTTAWGAGPRARQATAEYTIALAARGVRSVVVRLAPTNHGEGDNGFVATLVALARATGVSGYPGDGGNRWSAVHRLDTARLFASALEHAPAGATLHAVAETGVPLRTIAEAIGRELGLPVRSIPTEELTAHFGGFAPFASADGPASSAITQQLLGWVPEGPGLIADIEAGFYTRG